MNKTRIGDEDVKKILTTRVNILKYSTFRGL